MLCSNLDGTNTFFIGILNFDAKASETSFFFFEKIVPIKFDRSCSFIKLTPVMFLYLLLLPSNSE